MKVGPKELALKKQREENLEIPPFLKRTETPAQAEARLKKLTRKAEQETNGVTLAPPPLVQKALRKAFEEAKPPRVGKILSDLDHMPSNKSTKETPVNTATETTTTKRAAKPAPKKEKAAAKAKPAQTEKVNEPRGMAIEILKLAARPNGASRAELIKLTGWKAQAWKWYFVNSKDTGACQRFGYSLKVIEGKDGESRYKITKK